MILKELKPLLPTSFQEVSPIIIAGPCAAESEEQVIETAKSLSKIGVKIFRAGVWKPRTKPGGFEGVGLPALRWLRQVKMQTGMLVCCEVANKYHVESALEEGVDILWIGARTTANPFAVQEIADAVKYINPDIPILVKNPVNPDLELWIGALLRFYNAGILRLGAVHRGFSVYGKHLYRNVPQWDIPIELRLRCPNLKIIVDPSHIGGSRELIAPLSQQALDMGFDGLIIESHCNPTCALSDAAQQLTPADLGTVLNSLSIRDHNDSSESLSLLRDEIDCIDNEIIELLGKRMKISREIGKYKKLHGMPVVQPDRYNDVISSRLQIGDTINLDKNFLRKILLAIHDESVRQQLIINNS
ncbi:MAG: bifunctional 3-deoxy-7-phosphoheptulonate synthase/chorismate mutase type II [Prevotella sp.]|nr:bifunctional 3-deoxy-7-phosphoheptulonate synthase/chorismate mutase type II [Prevotella sp.]